MSKNKLKVTSLLAATLLMGLSSQIQAGPIFLSGHDPDFHAADNTGARNLLSAGVDYVVDNSSNSSAKFLWVESAAGISGSGISIAAGHRRGEAGITASGYTRGVDYDWVDGASLATVDFSDYSAIVVASDFGGMLMQAELDALNARTADIATFVNDGGGIMALSEGHDDGHTTSGAWFDFLPVDVSTGVLTGSVFEVTDFGASEFGLTDADVSTYSHSFFDEDYGLDVVSFRGSTILTLAGIVGIDDTGFVPTPAPTVLALMAVGIAGVGFGRRKQRR